MGKTYRLAPNFVEANARMLLPALPMEACPTVLDCAGAKLLTTLDTKAIFNNISLPKELERFCGIVTQDGVYTY